MRLSSMPVSEDRVSRRSFTSAWPFIHNPSRTCRSKNEINIFLSNQYQRLKNIYDNSEQTKRNRQEYSNSSRRILRGSFRDTRVSWLSVRVVEEWNGWASWCRPDGDFHTNNGLGNNSKKMGITEETSTTSRNSIKIPKSGPRLVREPQKRIFKNLKTNHKEKRFKPVAAAGRSRRRWRRRFECASSGLARKRRGRGQRSSFVSGSAGTSTKTGTGPGTTGERNWNCTSNGWPLSRRQRFHPGDRKNSETNKSNSG